MDSIVGAADGKVVLLEVGFDDGSIDGVEDGEVVGAELGRNEGLYDGITLEGITVGLKDGDKLGKVGTTDGIEL